MQLLLLQADPDVEKTAEAPESQVHTEFFSEVLLFVGVHCSLVAFCAGLFFQADPDAEKTAEAPESQVHTAVFKLCRA